MLVLNWALGIWLSVDVVRLVMLSVLTCLGSTFTCGRDGRGLSFALTDHLLGVVVMVILTIFIGNDCVHRFETTWLTA